MSLERRVLLAHACAKLVLTPARGHESAIARAEQLARERPTHGFLSSSRIPPTPAIHRETTAEEIWQDTDGKVDILVSAVAPGAESRLHEVITPRKPSFQAIAVARQRLPVISQCPGRTTAQAGPHKIQCTGADLFPRTAPEGREGCRADHRVRPSHQRRRLRHGPAARQGGGILVGISSGAKLSGRLSKWPSGRRTRAR